MREALVVQRCGVVARAEPAFASPGPLFAASKYSELAGASAALVEVTRLAAVGGVAHGYVRTAHVTLEARGFRWVGHQRVASRAQARRTHRSCRPGHRLLPNLCAA